MVVIQQESADKYCVLDAVKTGPRARTMALDLKMRKPVLLTRDFPTPLLAAAGRQAPRAKIVPSTFRILAYRRVITDSLSGDRTPISTL